MGRKTKPLKPCCDKGHPVVGDRVATIRTRHRWFDGRLAGKVTEISHLSTGRVSMVVLDDEGFTHEIRRAGDVKPERYS